MSMYNYKCRECGCEFDSPHVYYESHGFTSGPQERFSVCPCCGEDDYDWADIVEQEEVEQC